ncbi:MAG: FkbM family methyltransferase [Cyanobacteriota bacterium]|nr:FkbM family methyltransferase [Cyanobacteriota bacterium]
MAEILASMSRAKPVHILQVGANDGILYDPIHNILKKRKNITATRVEPVSEYFEELKENCSSFASRVELFNVCIGEEDGFLDLFLPGDSELLHLGDKGHGSINPEAVGRSREGLTSRRVPCKSFKSLMADMRRSVADVYVSDCEGCDIQLLRLLPLRELGVKVVFIELLEKTVSSHADVALALREAIDVVVSNGFNRIVWDGNDFLAWQSPVTGTSQEVQVEGFSAP